MKTKYSQIKINEFSHGTEIIVLAKKNYLLALFFLLWITGWAFGERAAIEALLESEVLIATLFLLVWLCGWSIAGVHVIFIWLWNLNGKEIIRIDKQRIKHQRVFTFFSRSIIYQTNLIQNLHVSTKNTSLFKPGSGLKYWGISGGKIGFNYKGKPYQLGSDLNEQDAKMIVQTIQKTIT